MKRILVGALFLLAGAIDMEAGEGPKHLTGNARTDFFSTLRMQDVLDTLPVVDTSLIEGETLSGKSPWLAGVLSLALPGAGQFYSESYWKSAAFFAAEAAAWIVAYGFDKKGDRQTNLFQDFADGHWSVVSYGMWLNAYRGQNISINPDGSLAPWQRVDWVELNTAERQVASGSQGYGFTHILPPHGEQQYYELIGKYDQYSTGWDDFVGGSDFFMISPRFREYSEMRGKANDYYSIASTAVSVVIINHVISAVDAFFTASRFSDSIHPEARMNLRQTPFGPVAETVGTIRVTF